MSAPVDFFIHVPKTAGTTMLRIIEDRYPRGAVTSLCKEPPAQFAGRIANIGPETDIVAGHVHYGFSAHLPRPFRAFAMLREPVERTLSLYYFVRRESSHPSHKTALDGGITIENLSRSQGSMQARFIAGYSPTEPVDPDVLLAQAKENLTQKLAVFGLTERFDETLLLLTQALGWKRRGYARENVTRNRPSREATDSALLDVIRANSATDLALYEFAWEIFEQRVAAQPAEFSTQLSALRRDAKVVDGVSRMRNGLRSIAQRLGLAKQR